jgi:hypothetical protein
VTIHDVTGTEVGRLELEPRSGLQTLQWDARTGNRLAAPGSYAARLRHDGETQSQPFQLHADPATQGDPDSTQPNDRGQE